jgi:hypothetical protein
LDDILSAMLLHRITLAILLTFSAAAARAGALTYDFTFTPTSGPVEAFEFSFVVPSFVTNGQSPAFTPFTITDGTNSATITQDLFVSDLNSCFEFGTAVNASLGDCTTAYSGAGGGTLYFTISTPPPAATGTYALGGIAGFTIPGNSTDSSFGNVNLTISNTPEPGSALLLLCGIAVMLAGVSQTRRRTRRP